jgi:hypothetical protein
MGTKTQHYRDHHFFTIKCLPVTVILKALWTRTENLDLPILNKRSIVVSVQFPLVPTATVEYKFDCIYLRKNNSYQNQIVDVCY